MLGPGDGAVADGGARVDGARRGGGRGLGGGGGLRHLRINLGLGLGVRVEVELPLQEEGVGDLHLAVGREAGALVDHVLVLLGPVDVDEALLPEAAARDCC